MMSHVAFFIVQITNTILFFCWDFCTILYNEGFIYTFLKEEKDYIVVHFHYKKT
jgi:hypothetical protein